ncbi:MAG: hypothetical protein CL907_04770 [Dehalococcoidia bacterium]|nr:hypothetical protein [Dehalococcoidia bacterium]|tara:strand:+ start:15792 stop:16439 length:648 start_codon:yes stop_codon:yes gene_type:complete
MKVLITDTNTEIASVLHKGLSNYEIETSDNLNIDHLSNFDCIIVQSVSKNCDTPEDINQKMQKTYNTLSACVEAGVKKIIMISTLSIMEGYKESYTVTEKWKPTPSTQFDNLSTHLSEFIFKEFGRTFLFQKILLRIGFPITDSDINKNKSSISESEFIKSINKIIALDFNEKYEVIHIQNKSENQRFLTNKFEDLKSLSRGQKQAFYTPKERRS